MSSLGEVGPSSRAGHLRVQTPGSGVGITRIVFGLIWAVDASLKWFPTFQHQFVSFVSDAKDGQPQVVKDWLALWVHVLKWSPGLFSHLVAVTETLIALALILGAFTNLVAIVGGLLSLGIWTTAEGFGGPYKGGSTDVGASIVYVVLFATLALAGAGNYFGLDARLRKRFPRARWLFSSPRGRDSQVESRPREEDIPAKKLPAHA